jgi:aspartokinase
LETAEIRINGIKISGECCLVKLQATARMSDLLPRFCHIMASSRINLPIITTVHRAGVNRVTCCVNAAQQAEVQEALNAHPTVKAHVSYTPGIGLLTLFPHRSSLTLFGLSLRALAGADIRVLELASSIGALTYVLDHSKLEQAAEVLKSCFKLVGSHAPFRADFVVSQATQTRPGIGE